MSTRPCPTITQPHLAPRGFALASPLPRPPRPAPRVGNPRPAAPPRLLGPVLDPEKGAGTANFCAVLREVGGLSTNEVSVVLGIASQNPSINCESLNYRTATYMKVVSASKSG